MSALSIKGLTKNFGPAEVICGVDLDVAENEVHAVIGPNGAGKSTFFNLLSGAFPPSSGEIYLKGERIDGLSPEKIQQRGLSRSFQVSNVFGNLSVFENIDFFARLFGQGRTERERRIADLTRSTGLAPFGVTPRK